MMTSVRTFTREDFENWGRKGGKARAESLTAEQLSRIGRKGAKARKSRKRNRVDAREKVLAS
jgi:hypothetical protein